MFNEQNGHALLVDLPDDGEDVLYHQRGQTQGGLIHQKELRAAHQRPAYGQHLLFAAGEGARQLPVPLFQPGEERIDPLEILCDLRLVPAEIGPQLQVLQHRQVGEYPPSLGTHGDTLADNPVNGLAQKLPAVPLDGAGGGLYKAGDGTQGGGLAGAVGADQSDNLAVRHLQGDTPQGLDAAVGHVEIFNFKHPPPPPGMRR